MCVIIYVIMSQNLIEILVKCKEHKVKLATKLIKLEQTTIIKHFCLCGCTVPKGPCPRRQPLLGVLVLAGKAIR